MTNEYFQGSELKFSFQIECEGFSMDNDPWSAVIRNGDKTIVCTSTENTVVDETGKWYLLVDTALLGTGNCTLVVEIDVPDSDFPDNYRHEVYKQNLLTIKRV